MTQLTTCPKCGGDVSDIVDVSPTQAIKADAKHGNCADQSPPSSVPPVTKGSGKWWEGISWHYVVFGVLCLLFPQLLGRIEAAATSHIVIGLGVVILVTILTLEVVAGKKKG